MYIYTYIYIYIYMYIYIYIYIIYIFMCTYQITPKCPKQRENQTIFFPSDQKVCVKQGNIYAFSRQGELYNENFIMA